MRTVKTLLEDTLVDIWSAILLGLVQGLAEFLPISSSGHLSVLQNLFHLNSLEEGHLFFDVLLHLGTLVSIFICYWKDIKDMVREVFIVAAAEPSRASASSSRCPRRGCF